MKELNISNEAKEYLQKWIDDVCYDRPYFHIRERTEMDENIFQELLELDFIYSLPADFDLYFINHIETSKHFDYAF